MMWKADCVIAVMVIALVFVSRETNAQLNLVPNPSFEDTLSCPYDGIGAGNHCALWNSCSGSPDYWTTCSALNQIPNCGPSFQYSHSGNKMMGVVTYATPDIINITYRELLEIDLANSVTSGQKYYFSMFINQAYSKNTWVDLLATNKIGVKLTNIQYSQLSPPPFNQTDYYDTVFHTDTLNWYKISGSLIATGNYSKLMIGNFFDDAHTDTMNLDHDSTTYQYALAYYFIDDVCLSADSLFATNWTGLPNQTSLNSTVTLYPNPVHDKLFLGGLKSQHYSIAIYDIQGRKILEEPKFVSGDTNVFLLVDLLDPGIYLLIISNDDKKITRRFVKN